MQYAGVIDRVFALSVLTARVGTFGTVAVQFFAERAMAENQQATAVHTGWLFVSRLMRTAEF